MTKNTKEIFVSFDEGHSVRVYFYISNPIEEMPRLSIIKVNLRIFSSVLST